MQELDLLYQIQTARENLLNHLEKVELKFYFISSLKIAFSMYVWICFEKIINIEPACLLIPIIGSVYNLHIIMLT